MTHYTYVVIGAAASGIGEAVTRRLLNDGHQIIGTFEENDANTATQLQADFGNRVRLHPVDHSSQVALSTFAETITDPVAGLVNAQFFFAMEDPDQFDHARWERSLAVNLTAPNILAHSLRKRLAKGSIVVITSTEGFIGSFGASAYAATKAAMHNLVKTLANNFGPDGIRVNALATGWIGGVMDTDEVFNMSRRITPLGRLGSPNEVAAVVAFLLSSEASFVNGTTIVVDGGYTGVDTISKYEFDHSRLGTGENKL